MSDSYARVLREIVGEPVVTGELWDTVTSVGEGDAGAYAEAIAAITRACGVASVDGALRDESTPGAVLDVMVDRFERYSGFFKPIAAHPNITPRVEEYCLSKRRVALNESLAASAGVSAEAVEKLLRSKSRGVIGALLGNSSLSEEQLRRAEWRARSIGTPMWLMARDACKNRAMPVDVVLSWLSDEREELKARAYALKSPVVPRSVLWGWLTHCVTQNGGWVVAVNPAHTSQQCHMCGAKVSHPTHELSVCAEHGTMDRDVNAAANIAARAAPRVEKARKTRAKNRKLRPQAALKTPVARRSLKYPGRDRTKSAPTPKRKNHRPFSKGVILPICPARAQAQRLEARVLADQGACCALGTNVAALKQGNVAYKCRLCSLI